MQPSPREERPPLVTIWRGIARNEPKTRKVELWQRASLGETAPECVCVCVTAEKAQQSLSNQSEKQKGKKETIYNSSKNPATGIPGESMMGRLSEWKLLKISRLSWELKSRMLDSSLWFFSSDVKEKEAKGRRGFAPVNSEGSVWRASEIFGISGTTDSGWSNKLLQPFEKPFSLFI